jgi:hypothetical protein
MACYVSSAMEGTKLLLMQVICQALEDHRAPAWRDEVDAFFAGPAFAQYCGLLGWSGEAEDLPDKFKTRNEEAR